MKRHMAASFAALSLCASAAGCADDAAVPSDVFGQDTADAGPRTDASVKVDAASAESNHGDGGSPGDASTAKPDAEAPKAETEDKPGNPAGKCSRPLPPEASLADVSKPSSVVGIGSAASCTYERLKLAVAKGGVITFDCGDDPVTIAVTATLDLPTDRSTVIDGGGKVTLDGGDAVRVLHWNSGDWQNNPNTLTLQRLTIAHGKAIPSEQIPARPAPCSQGWNNGEGGALRMRDGTLRAIEVNFVGNRAAELGPDTGGGALYLLGSQPSYVVRCTFKDNQASNAGGMGSLFTTNFIYDSLFENNAAVGNGANNDDATMCDFMNNGQHEVGSGGNGGAIYSDGVAMDVTICGTQVNDNRAGAFGAAVFFTSNDQSNRGTLTIVDSNMTGNKPKNEFWEWKLGVSTNAETVEPVNSTFAH
ncbi:MAG: hypothetical protein RL385_473 [Pseudomonadota bacterium]